MNVALIQAEREVQFAARTSDEKSVVFISRAPVAAIGPPGRRIVVHSHVD